MNKKQKSGIILASLASIAVAGSLIAGSTYALFTSESKTNIAVSSGTVDVEATISDLKTYSGVNLTGNPEADTISETAVNGTFTNGGTAEINEITGDLELDKVTPGDKVTFQITVKNKSNVAIKYRTIISCEDDTGLFCGLTFTIDGSKFDGLNNKSAWTTLTEDGTIATLDCEVNLPSDAENEYQDTSCKVSYTVEAVQGNAATTDPDANVIEIDNAAQLGAFRDIVNKKSIAEQKAAFNGKTIKLTKDIDLNNQKWTPIGWNSKKADGTDYDNTFKATFDGNGKTIKNFSVTKLGQRHAGLFSVGHYLTIENLTVDNATIEAANGVGAIVGFGYGVTIDTCTVTNSKVTASTWLQSDNTYEDGDKVGAIAGQLTEEDNKITNCTSSGNTIKGYRDVGGLAGYMGNSTSRNSATKNTVKDNTIINDRTHNYKGWNVDGDYDIFTVGEVVGKFSGIESESTKSGNTLSVVK